MPHLRLLIGFLNTSLCNTVQEGTSKRYLNILNHIKHSVSLFLSCTFYFVEQIKKCVTEWNKRFNLWSLWPLHHFLFLYYFLWGTKHYDIHTERSWGGLEICRVFTDSIVFKQYIFSQFLRIKGGCGGQ